MVAVLARLPPALARTDLALDDDGSGAVHHTGAEEWKEARDRRGGLPPRPPDTRGATALVPVDLGDAIGPALEDCRARVRRAIPAVVVCRVSQPMVARQVDQHRGAIFEFVRAVRAVRQREEQDITATHVLVVDEREARSFPEVRVGRDDRLPGQRFASGDDLIDLRMPQEQTQKLAARVTGGADHSNLHRAALATSRT